MRLAGMVMLGAAVAGRPMSCNEWSERAADWAEGEGNVIVTFEMPEGPGMRGVELRGCRGWLPSMDQVVFSPGQSGCGLVGWRQDGLLRVESEVVPIDSELLSQHVFFDTLPSGPIGGMGASVQKMGSGIRIERVLRNTPAEQMGLQVGDMVVAINGLSTADMSTTDFIRTLTGPPGDTVVLTVEFPAEVTGVEVTQKVFVRERIE